MIQKLKLAYALLRVLAPSAVQRALYGNRLAVVDGRRIDPSAQAVCDLITMIRAPGEMPVLATSRKQLDGMAEKFDLPCPADVAKSDITVPGADGPRPARLYVPKGGEDAPVLLYLHGGGWVQGSLNSHDGLCGKLAERAGIRVISLDYRLAPEHKFPAAPDDVLACYRALVTGETDLTIDSATLAVGGDSAGANLTAALMHDLAQTDLPLPAAQLLIYPAVDARLSTPSMQALAEQPLLPLLRIRWYLDQYLPDDQDRLDPRVSPLLSPHLAGQPPAMIIAGGHDPLWDDAHSHADALRAAGVAVTLVPYPGQVHVFMSLTKVIPEGEEAVRRAAAFLAQHLPRQAFPLS